jgi:hypothetical protein
MEGKPCGTLPSSEARLGSGFRAFFHAIDPKMAMFSWSVEVERSTLLGAAALSGRSVKPLPPDGPGGAGEGSPV